jgi:hypothetical protein
MKKILLVLLCFAFQSGFSQANEWEEWQKTSCYSNISFRLKEEPKYGEQHHWKIQFRSDYTDVISFNYHVTDKLQQYNITTKRKVLNAGQVSEEIDIYAKEADIFILVDKLSMSPYPEDFVECGR